MITGVTLAIGSGYGAAASKATGPEQSRLPSPFVTAAATVRKIGKRASPYTPSRAWS